MSLVMKGYAVFVICVVCIHEVCVSDSGFHFDAGRRCDFAFPDFFLINYQGDLNMTAAIIFVGLFIITGLTIIVDDGKWERKK